ncbi:hypothetical protein [Halococcus hamelinensis]|uniref:Uncharacterized protein n=1 Tax=Halococcus hamelinensis 100A6 TaxID=1132509 RepID=M0LZL7_9EURY|nr:hypothetical protein [Halococcus hamelinensis]EMA38992.1 hypothetical protein C447_07543 [Halococcus hamelinensis 100A6]
MANDDDRTGPDDGRFVFGDEGPSETSDRSLGAETVVASIVVVSVLGAVLFVIGFPFLGGLADGGAGAEDEPAGPTTSTAGGATERLTTVAGTRTTVGSATTDLSTARTTATAPPNATTTATATPTPESLAESEAPSAPDTPTAAASGTPTDTPASGEGDTPTEANASGEADTPTEADTSDEADESGEAGTPTEAAADGDGDTPTDTPTADEGDTPTDTAASGDADTPTDADESGAGDGDESPTATPGSRSPVVESFDVADGSNDTVAVFDVSWTVADPDDDLSGVTVGLVADPDGDARTVAERSFDAGGSESSAGTRFAVPDGAGSTYELRIEATDADGNTVFELTRAVADGEPDG